MAKTDTLSGKDELACQAYIKCGGNQSEAFRQSRDTSNMAAKTVWEEASKVFAKQKVITRVLELEELSVQAHLVTVETIAKELDDARVLAMGIDQPSAAVSASNGKAKLYGLLTDKQVISGPNGGPIEIDQQWEVEFINAPSEG